MAVFELTFQGGGKQSVDAADQATLLTALNGAARFVTLVADPGGESLLVNCALVREVSPQVSRGPN